MPGNKPEICPICDQENDCFESCFSAMLRWYILHYPHLVPPEELSGDTPTHPERQVSHVL